MEELIKEVQDYLLQLREPQSFKQLQEVFHDVESEKLKSIVNEFHEKKKITDWKQQYSVYFSNVISMFLSNKVKCNSVRIEYIEIEKHPMELDEAHSSQENDKEENSKKSEVKQEQFEFKKHDELNDEQLLEYKQELIKAKASIEERKKNLNTKSDKLKKIQERNEMKEIAGSIFQRIANIKNLTTKQIFEEYGLDNNEK